MEWIWSGFIAFVLAMLALDLGVFHRKAHDVSVREALSWTAVWVSLGLLFTVFIWYGYEQHWLGLGLVPDAVDGLVNDGSSAVLKYLTGYVVEKSLSVDNVFVIVMIFGAFAVPSRYQHRVLFWGVLGALAMRGVMIVLGAKLIADFHWVLYVFGVFLLLTGLKMLLVKSTATDPNHNVLVRWTRRWVPVTERYHGEHFLVRAGSPQSLEAEMPGQAALPDRAVAAAVPGTWLITPLMLALILVEATDLIFAVDSIPAIFAITSDPFLVFTSNVFAMLGLRSLYFALAGMIHRFRYLKVSLALVLVVVGTKMLVAGQLKAWLGASFNFYLLALVLAILAGGVATSWWANRRQPA